MAQSAQTIKKVSLELGGNAPFLVFDDADLDAAVEGAMISKYRNAGQTCVCANRILVQDRVYDAFAAKLAAKVKALKVGPGTEAGVNIGPLIDENAVAKVEEHIGDALGQGRQGDRRRQASTALGGLFFEPTVLTDVNTGDEGHQGGDLRPGGAAVPLQDRSGGHRHGQRHRVRAGGLLLRARHRPHLARRRGHRVRHGRHQHRPASPTRSRRSAASSSPASAARAPSTASRSISR